MSGEQQRLKFNAEIYHRAWGKYEAEQQLMFSNAYESGFNACDTEL